MYRNSSLCNFLVLITVVITIVNNLMACCIKFLYWNIDYNQTESIPISPTAAQLQFSNSVKRSFLLYWACY